MNTVCFFLIILGEEKRSTSGIKATITKLLTNYAKYQIDICPPYKFLVKGMLCDKKDESSKMPLPSNHNHTELFPVY